jgi:hypothetical protein
MPGAASCGPSAALRVVVRRAGLAGEALLGLVGRLVDDLLLARELIGVRPLLAADDVFGADGARLVADRALLAALGVGRVVGRHRVSISSFWGCCAACGCSGPA